MKSMYSTEINEYMGIYGFTNFPSSVAAAVRGGRPIVRTNKGHRGHLHFHKSFARGAGEATSTSVCLVWIYIKLFL